MRFITCSAAKWKFCIQETLLVRASVALCWVGGSGDPQEEEEDLVAFLGQRHRCGRDEIGERQRVSSAAAALAPRQCKRLERCCTSERWGLG